MVIRDVLGETVNMLKKGLIDNALFEANLIVRTVLNLKPIDVVLEGDKNVSAELENEIFGFARRRCMNEPLQYILGSQEFMGIEFKVSPDVLIPRADTETLVECVLENNVGMNILDICSGSGCIALSLAKFNKNAYVTGVDISDAAISLSNENLEMLNLQNRVKFVKTDILREIPNGVYDVIVSNPPYIKSSEIDALQDEVKLHEPHIALDGGEDGLLFYRRIIDIAPTLLHENGRLYFEVGYDQSEDVAQLMTEQFCDVGMRKDLCGVNRVVYGKKRR